MATTGRTARSWPTWRSRTRPTGRPATAEAALDATVAAMAGPAHAGAADFITTTMAGAAPGPRAPAGDLCKWNSR
ncbi:exported hypothetical protein [Cupriavidus taiwanensis]|nr:exported hypothetical protein [Cupriavidus taiwanensis]